MNEKVNVKTGDEELYDYDADNPDKTALEPHYLTQWLHLDNAYYSEHADELENILMSLNDQLAKVGVCITADEQSVLTFSVNQDEFNLMTQRRAGRKKKHSNHMLAEVMEYGKTHTPMETAAWLGLTRQTYYRKLKEHREANDEGKIEF